MMSDSTTTTTNTLTQEYRCNYCGALLPYEGACCSTPGCPGSIQASNNSAEKS